MTIKVMCVFGTRPEAIKMAPIIRELKRRDGIVCQVVVTAQHREMLDQVLDIFGVIPDRDLNIMKPNQTLAQSAASIFTGMDQVLVDLKPDWVLVQGDTTTVMTGALTAVYRQVKVGHVEAGLRTDDKLQPFPEEINRRVTSVVADLHFAPTEEAKSNLLRENIAEKDIVVTGNTAIDTLMMLGEKPLTPAVEEILRKAGGRTLVLVTAHRRENFGEPIEHICQAIKALGEQFGDEIEIVYPVHLNPNIQAPVQRILGGLPNIQLLEPLDYLSLVQLEKAAKLILTDSGGIQEEATALGKPTLVLRETTERPEGVTAGVLKLVGSEMEVILEEAVHLLTDSAAYDEMAHPSTVYGDGQAAKRIVDAILQRGA
ncbi:MAG TPA: UDP-N-acetylglucosamine 2-epimerase (non-hydrolyzing) [Bellilinea sp.]|nr:UDP-N-acetylglucosamine 2-epimerase (non-hydrolyzing) [Bellilinea sp.]